MNSPKKVLANILLEGLGDEYEGESLLKSSEFGEGAYTCHNKIHFIRNKPIVKQWLNLLEMCQRKGTINCDQVKRRNKKC